MASIRIGMALLVVTCFLHMASFLCFLRSEGLGFLLPLVFCSLSSLIKQEKNRDARGTLQCQSCRLYRYRYIHFSIENLCIAFVDINHVRICTPFQAVLEGARSSFPPQTESVFFSTMKQHTDSFVCQRFNPSYLP